MFLLDTCERQNSQYYYILGWKVSSYYFKNGKNR